VEDIRIVAKHDGLHQGSKPSNRYVRVAFSGSMANCRKSGCTPAVDTHARVPSVTMMKRRLPLIVREAGEWPSTRWRACW
jgi:hypothetical protein